MLFTFTLLYEQVHLEYDRRIQDAEMLEKHIIQARQKASDKEEHVQSQLMEDVGEAYHQLGLPPGTFTENISSRITLALMFFISCMITHCVLCPFS